MQKGQGILICEKFSGENIPLTVMELLAAGRQLAQGSGEDVGVFVLGADIEAVAPQLAAYGADTVYGADDLPAGESDPQWSASVLAAACNEISPSVVLFSHTDMGRDVAPRLAARLSAPIATDCIRWSKGPDRAFSFTKPVYGGHALAVWEMTGSGPCIATIRPRAALAATPVHPGQGRVVKLAVPVRETGVTLVETVTEEVKGIKLDEAEVVVAGGGGVGGKEGFAFLAELAELLKGAVGVSRVPCDEGWMSKSLEIGQTGRTISPKLYIAVGISGALQHMAGCSGSKCIVAINRDSDAQIFKEADLGIVGDYRKVVPALIEALRPGK